MSPVLTYCDSTIALLYVCSLSSNIYLLFGGIQTIYLFIYDMLYFIQVLTYSGFYDSNLEWIGLEGIQIIASINPGGSLGRHQLSTRLTSIVRLCSVDYPSTEQLQAVYGAYLQPVIQHCLQTHPFWGSVGKIHALASSMITVYDQV